jgi:uncharacterized protein YcbK (DUF882 family)
MSLRCDQQNRVYVLIILALAPWSVGLSVHAETTNGKNQPDPNTHEIQPGETLGEIALSYGITMQDLMDANNMDNPDKIFFGQKLILPVDPKNGRLTKAGVVLNIPRGFTLNRIASLYQISLKSIISANKLTDPDRLREGQTLLVPGVTRVVELVPPPPCFKDPVTIYRVRTDETLELPLELCNGRINVEGMKRVSKLTNSVSRPTDFDLHPRLIKLMQQVANHYPGRRLEVISGQRQKKQHGNESYHNKGQALDFRVEGVSNWALVQYLRGTFDKVGVGYYPNSVFVHMDVREKSAYWIDYSGPGERAIYGRKGMTKEEVQAIREKRRAKRSEARGELSAEVKVAALEKKNDS